MRSVWDELKHNLKKGVFINLILAVQFAVLFWMSTMIASYFLNMPVSFSTENIRGESAYYSLFTSIGSDADVEFASNASKKPDYISNQTKVIAELRTNPEYHFMAFRGVQGLFEFNDLASHLSEQEMLDAYAGSEYPGQFEPEGTPPDTVAIFINGMHLWEANFFGIDQAAMEEYRFQVSEGRLFEEEDFFYHWGQEEIPILLGNAVSGDIEVGDVLEGFTYANPCRFRVVGILEKGTSYISDMFIDSAEPASLDYAVIEPFFQITEPPRTEDEKWFADFNNSQALDGMIVVDADTPRSEVNAIERKLNDLYTSNGLYPLSTAEAPYGMNLFKTESETTMQILLGASILMGVISIAGICMSIIAKLNRNLHRYGIEIMNGQNQKCILAAFLLEILIIIAAGMVFNLWWFKLEAMLNVKFHLVILALALVCVAVTSAIFIRKLSKVDIEEIIRREE